MTGARTTPLGFCPRERGLVVAGGGGSVEAIVQHGQAGYTPFSECTETWQQNMQREERNRENVGNTRGHMFKGLQMIFQAYFTIDI